MKSATTPTAEELRTWAFDANTLEPIQDWDLVLSWLAYEDLFLELASTKSCPKSDYILSVLYLIVGDAVRTEYRNRRRESVEDLLAKAEGRFPAFVIRKWVKRSRELLAHPERFSYDDWCAGGFAHASEA